VNTFCVTPALRTSPWPSQSATERNDEGSLFASFRLDIERVPVTPASRRLFLLCGRSVVGVFEGGSFARRRASKLRSVSKPRLCLSSSSNQQTAAIRDLPQPRRLRIALYRGTFPPPKHHANYTLAPVQQCASVNLGEQREETMLLKGDESTVYAERAGKASKLALSSPGNPPNLGPGIWQKTRQLTRHSGTNGITRISMKTISRGIADSTLFWTPCNIESRPETSPKSLCGKSKTVVAQRLPFFVRACLSAAEGRHCELSHRPFSPCRAHGQYRFLEDRQHMFLGGRSSDIEASAKRLPLAVSFPRAFDSAKPRRAQNEAALNSRNQHRTISE